MTTTCSLIVKRAFIFFPFSFLRDFFLFANNNMSLYKKKETAEIRRVFLTILQSNVQRNEIQECQKWSNIITMKYFIQKRLCFAYIVT